MTPFKPESGKMIPFPGIFTQYSEFFNLSLIFIRYNAGKEINGDDNREAACAIQRQENSRIF
jgi:hypothetical protein